MSDYVFSLSDELLNGLEVKVPTVKAAQAEAAAQTAPDIKTPSSVDVTNSRSDSSSNDRLFRSQFQRFNANIALAKGKDKQVSEKEFKSLLDNVHADSDSESGSDSAYESDEDVVSKLLKKVIPSFSTHAIEAEEEVAYRLQRSVAGTPIQWFNQRDKSLPPLQVGVYRSILPTSSSANPLQMLKDLQVRDSGKKPRQWTMLMMGGGHFAAVVISLVPKMKKRSKKQGGTDEREIVMLRHKTFHRYTTRRKQGGAQSSNDNAKGNAKSIGAQMRREGERQLAAEIRELLTEWKEDLDASEAIFWRATSSANKRVLFEKEGGVLRSSDPRLKSFPFPTKRPTLDELIRAFQVLTSVKRTHFTEAELRQQDEEFIASITPASNMNKNTSEKPSPSPSLSMPTTQRLTPQEEAIRERWNRLLNMTRRGKADTLTEFLRKHMDDRTADTYMGTVNTRIPIWHELSQQNSTLLHVASRADEEESVRILLQVGADPCIPVPRANFPFTVVSQDPSSDTEVEDKSDSADEGKSGKTAYQLCRLKSTRNVFRRAMAEFPLRWDWTAGAKVPSALTAEMEGAQESKTREKRKAAKERMLARPAKPVPMVIAEEVKAAPLKTGPQRLGAAGSSSLNGLSTEMKTRLEREQRARAAEARFAKLAGGSK